MNFSKKAHQFVGQNEPEAKHSKHDANLQKNSTLYFQVGLILTLLAVHALFNLQFQKTSFSIVQPPMDDDDAIYVCVAPDPVPEPVIEKQPEPEPVRKPLIAMRLIPVEKPITTTKETPPIEVTPSSQPAKVMPTATSPKDPPKKVFSIIGVEKVPVYPGCEKYTTNDALRKCMSKKIGKLVGRKFNPDLAGNLGLSGKQRIMVQFKIDTQGQVTEIKTRAPHDRLETEAKKVISKIPKMIPGKQRNKNVVVIYSLPIVLQVE